MGHLIKNMDKQAVKESKILNGYITLALFILLFIQICQVYCLAFWAGFYLIYSVFFAEFLSMLLTVFTSITNFHIRFADVDFPLWVLGWIHLLSYIFFEILITLTDKHIKTLLGIFYILVFFKIQLWCWGGLVTFLFLVFLFFLVFIFSLRILCNMFWSYSFPFSCFLYFCVVIFIAFSLSLSSILFETLLLICLLL